MDEPERTVLFNKLLQSYRKYHAVVNGKEAQLKASAIWRESKGANKADSDLSKECENLQEKWKRDAAKAKNNLLSIWGKTQRKRKCFNIIFNLDCKKCCADE